jgi:hypothetical protein
MYQPWLAHHYPGLTLEQLERGYWTMSGYVAMRDFITDRAEG